MSNANGVFIVNFEHISHLVVELLLLNLNMLLPDGLVNVFKVSTKDVISLH